MPRILNAGDLKVALRIDRLLSVAARADEPERRAYLEKALRIAEGYRYGDVLVPAITDLIGDTTDDRQDVQGE